MHRLRVGGGKKSGQPDDAADRLGRRRGGGGGRRRGGALEFPASGDCAATGQHKRHSADAAHRASKAARAKRPCPVRSEAGLARECHAKTYSSCLCKTLEAAAARLVKDSG